jgi:preprotein translocase subunit SecA
MKQSYINRYHPENLHKKTTYIPFTTPGVIPGIKNSCNGLKLRKFLGLVNKKEKWAAGFDDSYFPVLTQWLKDRIAIGEKTEDIRAAAFALAREAVKRVLGERPFDEQIMGAYVLDNGNIAEMKAGEGKTLVCILAAYLNSLTGNGVHIITASGYLSKRNAKWMEPVCKFLGISTDIIYADMDSEKRKKAYACDITYGTSTEFAYDYLRDNIRYYPENKVQRNFSCAIVDEADSILIDESSTFLSIFEDYIPAGVQRRIRPLAKISFQNFFRMYDKLSGITATALTASKEFQIIYNMDVISIPVNKPVIRKDEPDIVFETENEKWQAVADEISKIHKTGQPVLAETVSTEKSKLLSQLLSNRGLPHRILNKNDEKDAHTIEQAGIKGAVTICINMAGYGTDIKPGGNPEAYPGSYEEIKKLGGLYVIGTECHESRRQDDQLRGYSGRRGDPGLTRFFISLEDSLFRINATRKCSPAMIQKKAEKHNFDLHRQFLEIDDILNDQRTFFYSQRDKVLISGILPESLCSDCSADSEKKLPAVIKRKNETIRSLYLHIMDKAWTDYLEEFELYKKLYHQTVPRKEIITEYQTDAALLFSDMMESIRTGIGNVVCYA